MRRLPVYLLLDCSESMIGSAIESVQSGVDLLIRELRRDPQALETAFVSIITFDGVARQLAPLTELTQIQVPVLQVRPGTALGAGLELLGEAIRRECRRSTPEQRGDFKPIVFILTDGQPTDEWVAAGKKLRDPVGSKIANVYAIGCGDDVDFDVLAQVSDAVFRLADMTPEKVAGLFQWLSASIQTASMAINADEAGGPFDMTSLPFDVTKVEPGSHPRPSGPPRQVFIPARCTGTFRDYIMRYKHDPASGLYVPVASHPLQTTAASEGMAMPKLNTSQLAGSPPCCHCENAAYGMCQCGRLQCVPFPTPKSSVCPWCQCTNHWVQGQFDVGQSLG